MLQFSKVVDRTPDQVQLLGVRQIHKQEGYLIFWPPQLPNWGDKVHDKEA
jgi:hypothetical protein